MNTTELTTKIDLVADFETDDGDVHIRISWGFKDLDAGARAQFAVRAAQARFVLEAPANFRELVQEYKDANRELGRSRYGSAAATKKMQRVRAARWALQDALGLARELFREVCA